MAPAPGCAPSPTRARSSSCRWRTSRSCSTGSRTWSRRGIKEIGIIVGDTARRDHGRGRRRLPWGVDGHLHPPGRAARPRALRADRPRLPRRRRLRDVPRRQHAAAGPDRVRRRVRGRARQLAPTDDTARHARGADPARPGRRPAPVRRGRGRRPTARSCSWSRSRPTRRRTSRSSACTCSTPHIHDAVRAIEPSRARRARDHRRDPVADRPRATACGTRCCRAGGSTPARRTRCSRATGSCSRRSNRAIDGKVDDGVEHRGPRGDRGRRGVINSTVRGPAIIGEHAVIVNSYVGPFTSIAAHCEIRRLRGRALRVAGAQPRDLAFPGSSTRWSASTPRCCDRASTPRATRLMIGDHSRVELA